MLSIDRNFGELPHWRRATIVVLIPLVLPALLFVVLFLSLVMAWNSFVYSLHWLRWKLFGVSIPPMCHVAGGGDEVERMQTQEGGLAKAAALRTRRELSRGAGDCYLHWANGNSK